MAVTSLCMQQRRVVAAASLRRSGRLAAGWCCGRLIRMSSIVAAVPAHARILTGVAPEFVRSLQGSGEWLPSARSAVLFVIDGLGAIQLRQHAGHARRLAQAMAKRDSARTVFPSTTAAALTSLLAGAELRDARAGRLPADGPGARHRRRADRRLREARRRSRGMAAGADRVRARGGEGADAVPL